MMGQLKWQWFWNLPAWIHTLTKKLINQVLVAEYDDQAFEPIAFRWKEPATLIPYKESLE